MLTRCVVLEMHCLAAEGADATGDEHQPGIHLAACRGRVRREKLARLLREIQQDRIAVEHHGLAIYDHRDLGIGVEGLECGIVLLALAGVDRQHFVLESGLFEEKGNLHRVGGGGVIEPDHCVFL